MLGLVDCNSFYASCEQALNPAYRGKPLVVLSNNDGIVIARSQEAKDLGVEDLIVYHKTKALIERHGIIVVSSNYTLYHDMSLRVKEILRRFVPEDCDEDYSIDESFLSLHGMTDFDLTQFAKEIQNAVVKSTRVPVSVGIAPTKVLCKVANYVAKRERLGSLVLETEEEITEALQKVPVEKVWGIGRKQSAKLRAIGISTAWDLKGMRTAVARKILTVVGERIVRELNGVPCIELDFDPPPQKQVLSTRSFGRVVTKLRELKESAAMHCHIAAKKLRKKGLVAKNIGVFVQTNRFDETNEAYYKSSYADLPVYTSATVDLIKQASVLTEKIFKPGIRYNKLGVILSDIDVKERQQFNLFSPVVIDEEKERLMQTLDQINHRYGKYSVRYAALPQERAPWNMRMNMKSPDYTTNWKEIPKAYV